MYGGAVFSIISSVLFGYAGLYSFGRRDGLGDKARVHRPLALPNTGVFRAAIAMTFLGDGALQASVLTVLGAFVACRLVARYVWGVLRRGSEAGTLLRASPFRYLLHRLRNPDPCDRRIVRAWLVPPQRHAHCGDIHLQESVPGRRLSKARPIHQEHDQDQPNAFGL
jgi:hypothetical protein